jgi:phosphoglycolate phosphatase-like HAD superfamily hydrolase
MNDKLILFDIDKTLIKKIQMVCNPWIEIFTKYYGVSDSTGLKEVDSHGRTHTSLAVEAMKIHGLDNSPENVKLFLRNLENLYCELLSKGEVFTYNGIRGLLDVLVNSGFYLGLVTGNTKNIAFAKLRRCDIDSFFDIGGFGDDSSNREDLVEYAIKRAEDRFNKKFSRENTFVIGDTPLDIGSAKKHGLKTIGVSTGVYFVEDLKDADYVLKNLEDIDLVLKIINNK